MRITYKDYGNLRAFEEMPDYINSLNKSYAKSLDIRCLDFNMSEVLRFNFPYTKIKPHIFKANYHFAKREDKGFYIVSFNDDCGFWAR